MSMSFRGRPASSIVGFVAVLLLLILSLPAATLGRQATPAAGDAPIPVEFPRDDGPHDAKIEWWYFTGHLFTGQGDRYGFEYVMFRANSGELEGYVSHFAIADSRKGAFTYDQRILGANGVAGDADVLDLDLNGWTMRGGDGAFALQADMPGYAMQLAVNATKPAALHDGDGYIDYGNGTASYYYSWTRMDISGELDLGSGPVAVIGEAWMDHQWGDFETYQDGGWDWFSIQLDNNVDLMLYLIRGPNGETLRVDGSIVGPEGDLTVLREGDFAVTPKGEWRSATTGTTYPSGWEISLPSRDLDIMVSPTLQDQELDTRATTGVIYWEGEVTVTGTFAGEPVHGLGYVELTGYAPYEPLESLAKFATPEP